MGLTPVEIDYALEHMKIIVDTREQDTIRMRERLKRFRHPYVREKISYGDYTLKYTFDGKNWINGDNIAVVERKMHLDELCTCFTSARKRFEREFIRAAEAGAHVHLIVENGNFEKIYHHMYKSKLDERALIASLLSWATRYKIQIHFCTPLTTPALIDDILQYELREYLKGQAEADE